MPFIPSRTSGSIQSRTGGAPESPGEAATIRIRRLLVNERDSAMATADRICRTVTGVGRADLDTDLGADAADLVTVYAALKTFILTLDPDAEVPDLPE